MSIIDLEKSLTELHKELTRLTPAIQLAEKAIETTNLAKAIPERHKQLIMELKTIFVNPDELESEEFVNVYSRITNLLTELHPVTNQINEYVRQISDLVVYLENNDIPNKLEAINFQLTAINNSLLAVQGQLNSIQSALNSVSNTVDNIRQNTEKILSDVKSSKEVLEEKIKSFEIATSQKFEAVEKRHDWQDKEIKTLKMILFVICGLIAIGSVATIVSIKYF
jgi:methyl-accepting chemotaxis protein